MMKKYMKILFLCSVIIITGIIISACSVTYDKKENSLTTAETPAPTTATEENKTTEETTTAEIIKNDITAKTETVSAETVLNKILSFPAGTAGSSIKSVEIALSLINFTENTDIPGYQLKADIDRFKNNLNKREASVFSQNLDEIDYMARELIKGENPRILSYLEDIGSENYDKGNYSLQKYDFVYEMMLSK